MNIYFFIVCVSWGFGSDVFGWLWFRVFYEVVVKILVKVILFEEGLIGVGVIFKLVFLCGCW